MPVVPGLVDIDQDIKYDTQQYDSGDTSIPFFTTPISSTVQQDVTNMTQAGFFTGDASFTIRGYELIAQLGATPEDLNKIYNTGWFTLKIGKTERLQVALRFIPAGATLYGLDNRSTGASQVSVQWYAGGSIFTLVQSIVIEPRQEFSVTMQWSAGQAVAAAVDLTFALHGLLTEPTRVEG